MVSLKTTVVTYITDRDGAFQASRLWSLGVTSGMVLPSPSGRQLKTRREPAIGERTGAKPEISRSAFYLFRRH